MLSSVLPVRERRGSGRFRIVTVNRWKPNVPTRRTLRNVAGLLDAGYVRPRHTHDLKVDLYG